MKPIIIIQGGQYGSEAKGAIAGYVCQREHVDVAVRTGATNAGHTVVYKGARVVMQQLPVGWVNPKTQLVLGGGALIDFEILMREIEVVEQVLGCNIRDRLFIDYRAGVHLPSHAHESKMHHNHYLFGATGKGCSYAYTDKIHGRGNEYKTFGQLNLPLDLNITDTASMLNKQIDEGAKVLLEGTQGTLLDIHFGPYPYTTHKQTVPANWMAEAGLSPRLPTDIIMVVRTYPIRVAGNSGPMPAEISWPQLARLINTKLDYAHPLVSEAAISAFEQAVKEQAVMFKQRGIMPSDSNGLDLHQWPAEQRKAFAVALSEIHREALLNLPLATITELKKLFEFTTVTKKLRRVADLNSSELRRAAMLSRPTRVAITFMNYIDPRRWFDNTGAALDRPSENYARMIANDCSAPVTHVSYGPGPESVVETFIE